MCMFFIVCLFMYCRCFLSFVYLFIAVEHAVIKQGGVGIQLTGFIPPPLLHLSLSKELDFQRHMSWSVWV